MKTLVVIEQRRVTEGAAVNLTTFLDEGLLDAELTTEHPASSYGLPVLMIDGEPYGPADLAVRYKPGIAVPHDRDETGRIIVSPEVREIALAARRAGYDIRPHDLI